MRLSVFLFLTLLVACKNGDDSHAETDRELARVYKKGLWLSDMEGMFAPGMSRADSSATIAAFVANWTRTQLMEYEAERNIPQDLNIDELVRSYRASLLRHKYEEQIFGEKLDTAVSEAVCRDFYDKNRDLFLLTGTVLRCFLLKMKTPVSSSNELQKAWSSSPNTASPDLREYASRFTDLALLDEKKWYALDEIAAILPKGTLVSGSVSKRDLATKEDGYQFYVRVLEAANPNESAPYEQARERIEAMILHKRKIDLVEKWQNELYDGEIRRKNVKIF